MRTNDIKCRVCGKIFKVDADLCNSMYISGRFFDYITKAYKEEPVCLDCRIKCSNKILPQFIEVYALFVKGITPNYTVESFNKGFWSNLEHVEFMFEKHGSDNGCIIENIKSSNNARFRFFHEPNCRDIHFTLKEVEDIVEDYKQNPPKHFRPNETIYYYPVKLYLPNTLRIKLKLLYTKIYRSFKNSQVKKTQIITGNNSQVFVSGRDMIINQTHTGTGDNIAGDKFCKK